MGKYTTTLYNLARMKDNTMNFENMVEYVRKTLFDSITYPFYNSSASDKKNFEKQFVKMFFFEPEINFETPARFIFELDSKLNEIMPYYERLYLSLNKDLELYLNNVNYSITKKNTEKANDVDDLSTNFSSNDSGKNDFSSTDNGTSNQNVTGENQTLQSDEPQTTITNNAYASMLTKNENQDTSATTTTNTSKQETNVTNASTQKTTSTNIYDREKEVNETLNYLGSMNYDYGKALQTYRENIININQLIYAELRKTLFLYLY